jgi:hypothetical protein
VPNLSGLRISEPCKSRVALAAIVYRFAGLSSSHSGLREVAIATKPTKANTSSRTSSHGGIGNPETTHGRPRQHPADADGVFFALASPTPTERRVSGFVPSLSDFLQISLRKF